MTYANKNFLLLNKISSFTSNCWMILVQDPFYKSIVFRDDSSGNWSYRKIVRKKFIWEDGRNAKVTQVNSTYEKRKQEEKKQRKFFLHRIELKLLTESLVHRANN